MTMNRRTTSQGKSQGQWWSGATNWLGKNLEGKQWLNTMDRMFPSIRNPGGGVTDPQSWLRAGQTGLSAASMVAPFAAPGAGAMVAGSKLGTPINATADWASRMGNIAPWLKTLSTSPKLAGKQLASWAWQAPWQMKVGVPATLVGNEVLSDMTSGRPAQTTSIPANAGRGNRTSFDSTGTNFRPLTGQTGTEPGTGEGADDLFYQSYLDFGGMLGYQQWIAAGKPELDKPRMMNIDGQNFWYDPSSEYSKWNLVNQQQEGQSLADQLALTYAQNPYLYWAQMGTPTPESVAHLTGGRVQTGQELSGPAALGNLSMPSAQWWNNLGPNEQEQVMGALNWMGIDPEEWYNMYQRTIPSSRERQGVQFAR